MAMAAAPSPCPCPRAAVQVHRHSHRAQNIWAAPGVPSPTEALYSCSAFQQSHRFGCWMATVRPVVSGRRK